jgi:hypothetical protein
VQVEQDIKRRYLRNVLKQLAVILVNILTISLSSISSVSSKNQPQIVFHAMYVGVSHECYASPLNQFLPSYGSAFLGISKDFQ